MMNFVEHMKTKPFREITTSYMGVKDTKAIEVLAKIPSTEVHISQKELFPSSFSEEQKKWVMKMSDSSVFKM